MTSDIVFSVFPRQLFSFLGRSRMAFFILYHTVGSFSSFSRSELSFTIPSSVVDLEGISCSSFVSFLVLGPYVFLYLPGFERGLGGLFLGGVS